MSLIRPECRALYPKNWKKISEEIRFKRAGNKCEGCGAPNGRLVARTGETGEWRLKEEYDKHGYPEVYRVVKIVLTVAHLDHNPRNSRRSNLRAWCQKCHNSYDMPNRRRGIRDRSRRKAEGGTM